MESKNLNNGKKVVTFGEVMLRLTTPGFKRFAQAGEFVATYGGSEANVALSLAHFGVPTEFVTRLPDNAIARACIASLRAGGLGTEGIVFGGKRMGIYFLEPGAAFRNSNVVYDREDSAFATIGRGWSTGSGCSTVPAGSTGRASRRPFRRRGRMPVARRWRWPTAWGSPSRAT